MNAHDKASQVDLTDRFREFHRLTLTSHPSYHALYTDYLKTGMRLFDMPIGIVSHICNEQYTILAVQPDNLDFTTGDVMPLGQTYCSVVVGKDATMAITHAGQDAMLRGHPAYKKQGVEAYLATPIRVTGAVYGTLNFSSPHSRDRPFDELDIMLVELMSSRISQVIEQTQIDFDRLDALGQLRENTELFEAAFNYAAIGMALVSLQGRWLRVNRSASRIFGYSERELLEVDFQSITYPEDLDADLAYLRQMLVGKRDVYRMEKRYFHKNGQIIWALLSVSMVRDKDGKPAYFVSQIQDITAQKRAESELLRRQQELESLNRRLETLSTTDPLTQLGNRREADRRMQEELHRSARTRQPLSLLVIDIDHFKGYNDTHGHPEGDVALRKLAAVLQEVTRVNDSVARLGGEEFLLVLPQTDESGCRTMAERVNQGVSKLEGLEAPITVSTGGVTLLPGMHPTKIPVADDLVKSADKALYRAKQEGRNRHCQAPTLTL